MRAPVQITFRNVNRSDLIEQRIRTEAAKLETFYKQLLGCRVAVEVPHRHHRNGSHYRIRIDLTLPGGEIIIRREPSSSSRVRQPGEPAIQKHLEVKIPHKNLRLAINAAFKAASRRLQDYACQQRGHVKNHAQVPEGRVSKILPQEGYGFLTSNDGREIYFHRNSVLHRAFAQLKIGTTVRFAEEPGEKGPQANRVRMVCKP